jgi:hypothetical protein
LCAVTSMDVARILAAGTSVTASVTGCTSALHQMITINDAVTGGRTSALHHMQTRHKPYLPMKESVCCKNRHNPAAVKTDRALALLRLSIFRLWKERMASPRSN